MNSMSSALKGPSALSDPAGNDSGGTSPSAEERFLLTVVLLAEVSSSSPAGQGMPQSEKFKVAAAGFASIGFMNLSLTYNSVGFYQVSLAAAATCPLHAQPGEQERRQPPSHTHTPSHTTRPAQLLSSSRSSLQAEQSHGLSHGCASARRSRSSSSSP